jgi:hypothetical protein
MTRSEPSAEDGLFEALGRAAEDLTEEICLACEREIDVYRLWADKGEGDRLRATVRVILDHFAETHGSTELAGDLEQIGAQRASEGLPLEAIPSAWLIISDRVWRWVVAQTAQEPGLDLLALWSRFLEYVGQSVGAIQRSYVRTRSEAFAAEMMMVRATLDRLIDATAPEQTEHELVRIGHPGETFRILLCQHQDPGVDLLSDEHAGFRRLTSRLAGRQGRRQPAWTMWNGLALILLTPDVTPEHVADQLAGASSELRAVLSRSVPTRSLLRPLLMRTVSLLDLTTEDRKLIDVEELTLVEIAATKAAITEDELPTWVRRFFEGDTAHENKWTETLRALVDARLNIQDAASALFVHQNTVYYRLEAIKKHCGVDLRDPSAIADLHLAVHLRETSERWRPFLALAND